MLNASQGEYTDWLNVVGMKIIIHQPDDTVFPDTNGYGLSPGYDTSFSLHKVSIMKQKLMNLSLNRFVLISKRVIRSVETLNRAKNLNNLQTTFSTTPVTHLR